MRGFFVSRRVKKLFVVLELQYEENRLRRHRRRSSTDDSVLPFRRPARHREEEWAEEAGTEDGGGRILVHLRHSCHQPKHPSSLRQKLEQRPAHRRKDCQLEYQEEFLRSRLRSPKFAGQAYGQPNWKALFGTFPVGRVLLRPGLHLCAGMRRIGCEQSSEVYGNQILAATVADLSVAKDRKKICEDL